jgi:PleD family two-component response regulator
MDSQSINAGEVLIVDDTPEDLALLKFMLEEHNFSVRQAINSESAMRVVDSCHPELILLDIMMPEMDGYEFCRSLKACKMTDSIPVIFVSALVEPEDKVKAFTAGGVDFISKPFQNKEVLARVKTHLTIGRLQKHLERKNDALRKSLTEIQTLQGFIPICSWCKKIRDDSGFWQQVEEYFAERSGAVFNLGICPNCTDKCTSV